MSIRLDPRRLNTLRALAAEAGVRPGELVTLWVEQRLDAERTGAPVAPTDLRPVLDALNDRVNELARRVDALAGTALTAEVIAETALTAVALDIATEAPAPPRKRGRPPKARTETPEVSTADAAPAPAAAPARKRGRPTKAIASSTKATTRKAATRKAATKRSSVPLHEELIAVISERGPQTAAELAIAVAERGVYSAPRSSKPLDAATVNARVSNPVYRSRFSRAGGKIGLAKAK
jgi:hypothetical protein